MRIAALVPVTGSDCAFDINRALASVQAQTHPDVALYVFYSGPGTPAVDAALAPFAAYPGCVVLRSSKRHSAAAARNALMAAAPEQTHAFLDSDDEWLPDHLADFATRYADVSQNSGSCLYFTDYRQRQSGHDVRFDGSRPKMARNPLIYLLRQPVLLSSVIAHRLTLEFPEIRAEDFAYCHAALNTAGTVIHSPEIRVIYDQQRRRTKGLWFKIRRSFRLMNHIVANKPAALGLTALFLTLFVYRKIKGRVFSRNQAPDQARNQARINNSR